MAIGRRAKPRQPYLRRGHPMARGLVALWAMPEAIGGIRDVVGRAPDGTLNGPAWTTGPYGPALLFDSTDYVSIQASGSPLAAGNSAATIVALFATDAADAAGGRPIYAERPNATSIVKADMLPTTVNQEGEIFLTIRDSNSQLLQVFSDVRVDDGLWHLCAWQWEGTTGRVYVDGALANTGSNASLDMTNWPSSTPIYIGQDPHSGEQWAGTVGLVGVWQRALTPREIAELAADPFALVRPRRSLALIAATQVVGGLSIPVAMHHYRQQGIA